MYEVILAFVGGVICGICYMYLRYANMMKGSLRTIQELRLEYAKLETRLRTYCKMRGIKWEDLYSSLKNPVKLFMAQI